MNQLAPEKQKAIIQGYGRAYSIRLLASIVQCSPITVRKYLRLDGSKIRTVSEGMIKYHELRRYEQELCRMMECYGLKPSQPIVMACGKTRQNCVNCRDIFSQKCGFEYWRVPV
jgi:hypothetical protein